MPIRKEIQHIDQLVEEAIELVGADENTVMDWTERCKCRRVSHKRASLEEWARRVMSEEDKLRENPDLIKQALERLEQLVGKPVKLNSA